MCVFVTDMREVKAGHGRHSEKERERVGVLFHLVSHGTQWYRIMPWTRCVIVAAWMVWKRSSEMLIKVIQTSQDGDRYIARVCSYLSRWVY